jgi:hypothetical protein
MARAHFRDAQSIAEPLGRRINGFIDTASSEQNNSDIFTAQARNPLTCNRSPKL